MEEAKVKGKVSRKEARRKRNMRNTVIMAALSVALLGGATYAWFSLSETAQVTNLTLTVGEAGGLQIANVDASNNVGTYSTILELPDASGVKLLPATCETTIGTIKAPTYENGEVTGTTDITSLSDSSSKYHFATFEEAKSEANKNAEVYFLKKEFNLKTEKGAATDLYDIVLDPGTGWNADGILGDEDTNTTGTYLLTKEADANGVLASAAIRVSFENVTPKASDNSTPNFTTATGIYEPNSNLASTAVGVGAKDSRGTINVVSSTVAQDKDGDFDTNTENSTAYSGTLFQIAGGKTENRIVMKIWLEGTDAQCLNEAALETLVGQLKFRMVD